MGTELIIAGIGVAISAASAGYSIYSSEKAADEAEAMADANAKRQEAEAEEMARRAEKDAARQESLARAKAFASGVGGTSQEIYLDDLHRSNQREIDWIRKSGGSQAAITKSEGRTAADAHRRAGVAAGIRATEGIVSSSSDWFMASQKKKTPMDASFDASADAKSWKTA